MERIQYQANKQIRIRAMLEKNTFKIALALLRLLALVRCPEYVHGFIYITPRFC